MKIWIDFINTPQVSFFLPFIEDFKRANHNFVLTCRDSGNTIDLLKQNELPFKIVGDVVKKNRLQKILFFPFRLVRLYFYIRKEMPDVAVSQSSFYQPIVARLLNIPSLYTNDNEHAKGNFFAFLFANQVILPTALKNEPFTQKWPLKNKTSFYPSIKEAVYLSQQPQILKLLPKPKKKIYFRPEPWSAEYYNGPENFFDEVLIKLSKRHEIIVLPRDKEQAEHYNQAKFDQLQLARKPLPFKTIVADCLLFIGAGGSMSRELATIGVPVISIYQSKSLLVDKYLVGKGKMKVQPQITADEIIKEIDKKKEIEEDWSILKEGGEAYEIISNRIKVLGEHQIKAARSNGEQP